MLRLVVFASEPVHGVHELAHFATLSEVRGYVATWRHPCVYPFVQFVQGIVRRSKLVDLVAGFLDKTTAALGTRRVSALAGNRMECGRPHHSVVFAPEDWQFP